MEEPDNRPMDQNELISFQLKGKAAALERYDAILWKIRAGYVAILYGVVGVLWGKDFNFSPGGASIYSVSLFCLVTAGFSVSAFLVDLSFLTAKLRVVEAYNQLSDLVLDLQKSGAPTSQQRADLKRLLHLSGEAIAKVSRACLWQNLFPVFLIYFCTPALGALFLLWQ